MTDYLRVRVPGDTCLTVLQTENPGSTTAILTSLKLVVTLAVVVVVLRLLSEK
jgi:hypothetical protein